MDSSPIKPMSNRHAPGMRRVRLLVWALYYRTPLDIEIGEWVERGAARRCKLTWEQYCELKRNHPEEWQRAEARRKVAKANGGFAPQPPQFQVYRKLIAKQKRLLRKPRPRFTEWAGKKLVRARGYKRKWLRERVTDRLFHRLVGE